MTILFKQNYAPFDPSLTVTNIIFIIIIIHIIIISSS